MVTGATHLVAGAGGVAPDGGVCLPGEFSITAGAFALGQVLDFGSLDIANCYDELRLVKGIEPADNESLASSRQTRARSPHPVSLA
jgi:hypothetical protein